jgi:endonuclease/exonuclease/phosphatase (EEP) superfamily protein YafD
MEMWLLWGWVMGHSLLFAIVPTLLLGAIFTWLAWQGGGGWRNLAGVPLAGVLLLALAFGLGQLVPTQPAPRSPATTMRVLHFNALVYNRTPEALQAKATLVQASGAELVSVVELNGPLLKELQTIRPTYPFQQVARADVSMWLGSVYPLTKVQTLAPRAVVYHVARPAMQGGAFYVVQVHPASPHSPTATQARNLFWQQIAQAVPLLPRPLLMVGDFNTTPWDTALQPLQPHFGLAGGWQAWLPTFPSWAPLTPIDHLYASLHWPKAQAQRVRVAGSDHLGLVIDFQ